MRYRLVVDSWRRLAARVGLLLVLLAATLGGVSLAPLSAQETEKPVVRFLLFYGETCSHCHEVMENYLPTV